MAAGQQGKAILFSICRRNICQFKRAVFPQCEFQYGQIASYIKNQNQVCSLMSMFPRTPDAQTVTAEWLRGMTYKAILFSICWRNIFFNFNEPFFLAICLWLKSCPLGMCWHGRARMHPNIDVSQYAICTACRGWMAAGYQVKGNIVFYLLRKYFSI